MVFLAMTISRIPDAVSIKPQSSCWRVRFLFLFSTVQTIGRLCFLESQSRRPVRDC